MYTSNGNHDKNNKKKSQSDPKYTVNITRSTPNKNKIKTDL